MGIFGNIMDKIFRHKQTEPASAPTASTQQMPQPTPVPAAPASEVTPVPQAAPAATPGVDVGAVLSEMAAMKNGGGNYQTSIVDLLKLLDLDSSLADRKELAEELNVHVGEDGSAEQNIALHKAVMNKLSENGGVVPDSLRQ
ncbi:DUF3597 domain-containing protein [Sphingomonas floccifaciens]|uniref:DUF3597 domain-containing protein n=1 Tax=Sphingomonas floccifaciens TaxID=1844115 RepID=A0ABW4NGG3_9SPHN